MGLSMELSNLNAQLETSALTDEKISDLTDFAEQIRQGLINSNDDFATRRKIVDLLDVRGVWFGRPDDAYLNVSCILGEKALSLMSTATSG